MRRGRLGLAQAGRLPRDAVCHRVAVRLAAVVIGGSAFAAAMMHPAGTVSARVPAVGPAVGSANAPAGDAVAYFRLQQPTSSTATPRIQLPTKTADAAATGTAAAGRGTATPGVGGRAGAVPSATAAIGGGSSAEAPGAGASGAPAPGGAGSPSALGGSGISGPDAAAGGLKPGASLPGKGPADGGAAAAAGGGAAAAGAAAAEAEAARRAMAGAGTVADNAPGPRGVVPVPVPAPEVMRQWTAAGSPWRSGEAPLERLVGGRPWPFNWWPFYVLLAVAAGGGFVWMWRRVNAAVRA